MARVLPVQEPVVIHWPARRPPVRAAPSLASQGRSLRRSPEVLEPVRSTRTMPSTARVTFFGVEVEGAASWGRRGRR